MSKIDDDQEYLQGAVGSLESYLLSNELFYPLGGGFSSSMVSSRLSLGALLLTLARLSAKGSDSALVDSFKQKIDAVKSHWRVHWENKAARELSSRLTLWQNALADLGASAGRDQSVYAVEVKNRVMVDLLRDEAGSLPEHEVTRIDGLDHTLRAQFVPGEFVWELDLMKAFPQDKFWYLYGNART